MRKNVNAENIEGKVYQFKLEKKVTGENSKNPGTEFISGTVDVATSAAQDNIIQVHYTYVAPTYNSGKTNTSFNALKQIMESGKTVLNDGWDAATVVRLNPSYALNDFYRDQGKGELVSTPRNEGGFVTIMTENAIHPEGDIGRNKFEVDIVINNVSEVVPDEGDSYVVVKGVTFDFRNTALPITLTARNKAAGQYFLNLNASNSNPIYTKVWGKIVNVFTKTEKVTESAFGEASVEEVTKRTREYVITGANPVPYEFDTEETMTAAELTKALQDREVALAENKKRTEEYYASQGSSKPVQAAPTAAVPQGGFKF